MEQRVTALAAMPAPQPAVDPARITALSEAVDAIRQRLDVLEKHVPAPAPTPAPAPAPVDLGPLEARIAQLEQRPAAPRVDLEPLEQRVAKLEQRQAEPPPTVDLQPLLARIAALEQRPAQAADPALASRVDALAADQKTTEQRAAAAQSAAARAVRLQEAAAALRDGRPLGTIPNGPPALARFDTQPPPTEAQLRLEFPQAAAAALAASQAPGEGLSLGQQVMRSLESLVTVRQGDRVILGKPASQTLATARLRLDAGDLAGAVAALDALDPPAAAAISGWRDRAQSLLDARAALAMSTG